MDFNLNELQARREAAIERGERWPCSAGELLEAYVAGERDFSGADLYCANLHCANLSGANLSGAKLSRADLSDANLSGANLSDANLSGANLSDANLSGANLPENVKVFLLSPVGSRRDGVAVLLIDGEVDSVCTGCFSGTLAEFEAAVVEKPDGDPYRVEYEQLVIPAIRAFFALHTVKQGA